MTLSTALTGQTTKLKEINGVEKNPEYKTL
jgi:hypothetical protein